MYATTKIPKRIQHKRWCRNGHHPDAWSIRQAAACLCHVAAYRRKIFLNAKAPLETMNPGVGPTVVWRCSMRTGLAVSELRFRVIMGLDQHATGNDTHVEIDVTVSGGATTTKRIDYGANGGTYNSDQPFTLAVRDLRFTVSPSTVYQIAIESHDGARPIGVIGYEWADPEIDDARSPFVELQPTVFQPVLDSIRDGVLGGLSDAWLSNGIHLLTWPGLGSGSARTITSTTPINVHDGTSATPSASTPGYYLGAEGAGDGALTNLQPWCRLKDGDELKVTVAAYANTTSVHTTGVVGLHNSTGGAGNRIIVSGIDSTLQWWTADVTLDNVSAIPTSGKMDLQAYNTTGGQSVNVYAFSAWLRNA